MMITFRNDAKKLHDQSFDDEDHVLRAESQGEQGTEVGDSVKGSVSSKAVGHDVQGLHDTLLITKLPAHARVALTSGKIP